MWILLKAAVVALPDKLKSMKKLSKITAVIVLQMMFTHFAFSQTSMKDVPTAEASVSTKPTPTIVYGKELTVTIKNTSELPVYIFAGPREEVRNPKVQELGGISLNKLYLRENEVICLVSKEGKPSACTVIKPGTATAEVNSSGTNISSK